MIQFCGIVEPIRTDSRRTIVKLYDPTVTTNNKKIYERMKKNNMKVTLVKNGEKSNLVTLNETYRHSLSSRSFSKLGKKNVLKPTKYQKELADILAPEKRNEIKRFIVFWNMGSGKTFGVLNALKDCPELTIVCPITLIVSTWLKTFRAIECDPYNPVQVIDIMGPDVAKRMVRENPSFFEGKIVVIDEIQMLRNASSTVMKVIIDAISCASLVVGVTGTPLVNSEREVDYIYDFLGESTGDRPLEDVVKGRVHYYWNTSKTMPEIVEEIVHVEMTGYQTMYYACCIFQTLRVGNFEIQTRPRVSAFKTIEAQICTRAVHGTIEHCPKIDVCTQRVVQNIDTGSLRQAIYCHFIESLADPLMKKLKKIKGIAVDIIQGKTPSHERQKIIESYNCKKNDEPRVIIFTDAANLGISLKRSTHIHILDVPANKATYDQIVFRTARKGSHIKGSKLIVVLYVSKFQPIEAWNEEQMFNDFIDTFDDKRYLDVNVTDLIDAVSDRLRARNFMTVEEQRLKDMSEKASRIEPYLKVLKKCR
jgi:Helicase conserved C-terminal domain